MQLQHFGVFTNLSKKLAALKQNKINNGDSITNEEHVNGRLAQ